MTLIVCLTGENCIVMAADSKTTQAGKEVSCITRKIHDVSDYAITAGCGLAKVAGKTWEEIFDNIDEIVTGEGGFGSSDELARQLRTFLDRTMKTPTDFVHGACRGGNTFLLGTFGVEGQPIVTKFERNNDDREFAEGTIIPLSEDGGCIVLAGDVASLPGFEDRWHTLYRPGMPRSEAQKFGEELIREGIAVSASLSVTSIGGDFISVVTVDQEGIQRDRISVRAAL